MPVIGPPGSYRVYVVHYRTPTRPDGRRWIGHDQAAVDQFMRWVIALYGYQLVEPVFRMPIGQVPDEWYY